MSIQKLESLTKTSVEEFSKSRQEPAWLKQLRLDAWNAYAALPFPKKEEEWRRIDLRGLDFPSLKLSINGSRKEVGFPSLPKSWAGKGVKYLPLLEAAGREEALVRPLLEQAVQKARTNKFSSLNLALFSEGFFLLIPRGVALEEPFHHRLSFGEPGASLFTVNLVFLEPGSQLTYWEELGSPAATEAGHREAVGEGVVAARQGETAPAMMIGWNHIRLGEDAGLTFLKLQHLAPHVCHFSHEEIHQERSSRLREFSMAVGSKIAKTSARTRLEGPGAENEMLGVLFGSGQQQFDHWAFQDHVAPSTKSNLEYRGVLKGSARSSFIGLVTIEKQAQKSDAYQSNRNLLLSREARADAIPKLEILADDVKCGHGSASGPVDEEQMFYLMTRGIPRPMAERMIVEAFFDPVLSKIPEGPVLEELRSFLNAKLDK